ncbi:hypothetical protein QJS04_geneDACA025091 [Acorus gramineus]|uniref:Uncharacterized protein n=1 Tax=Acorus gramineus TaxID=55184 RepID=A0AAV8ZXY7_ACOGR|nr:hypothetical protein QJS04_geneDACA025091 [Acorus gramineus]
MNKDNTLKRLLECLSLSLPLSKQTLLQKPLQIKPNNGETHNPFNPSMSPLHFLHRLRHDPRPPGLPRPPGGAPPQGGQILLPRRGDGPPRGLLRRSLSRQVRKHGPLRPGREGEPQQPRRVQGGRGALAGGALSVVPNQEICRGRALRGGGVDRYRDGAEAGLGLPLRGAAGVSADRGWGESRCQRSCGTECWEDGEGI